MHLLIYPEDYNDEDSLSNPPSAEPTPEPGPPSKKTTKETTSEPDSDYLSEPSAPTREDSIGCLSPKGIVRYQKVSDTPRFTTLEEHTKESPWGGTWKIRVLGQDKSLEAVEDLLTPTRSSSQIPTNLEEVYKDLIGAELTREDIAKLCSTEDLLGWDEREILFWHQRPNHCSFKSLIRLSSRGVIPRKLIKIRKLPPFVACIFGKSHKRPWSTKGKH